MTQKPQLIDSTIVAHSRLFDIEDLHLRFSNGVERHFERIKGRSLGSVMIVPMLNDHTVLLIREYSAGVEDYVLGFPKGSVQKAEDLLATAERELKEEVGYGARDLSVVARFSASPAYLHSMMHIVLAKNLYPQREVGDEPESMEVIPWDLNRVDELLIHPEFHEARSVAALYVIERQRHA